MYTLGEWLLGRWLGLPPSGEYVVMSGYRNRFLTLGAWLAAQGLCWPATAAVGPESPVVEVTIGGIDPGSRQVSVAAPGGSVIAPGSRLLLGTGAQPFAWANLTEASGPDATFKLRGAASLPADLGKVRGWVVRPDLVALLADGWPTGAALQAEIDTIGPGGASAWLRAGTEHGVSVGASWWLRVGGQPAARFDVRFAAPEACFCAVVPLAADPRLRPGARVALWPSPSERRAGRASSAISYIEERGGSRLIWVAAPRGVACPSEPHLDFFHCGNYVGHGLAELQDDRFWYASFTPFAGVTAGGDALSAAGSEGAGATTGPVASRPCPDAGMVATAPAPPRIGDPVLIRTKEDIARRRFVARVFELTPAGALVNAGEADGLANGQRAMAYRAGSELGTVAFHRVQRSYAVVRPVAGGDATPLALRVGDELRLGPRRRPSAVVGFIHSVVDEALFTARLTAAAPLVKPLAVRAGGRTIGVAVVVVAEESSAGGFVLPCSMTAPLAVGMELVLEADEHPGATDR